MTPNRHNETNHEKEHPVNETAYSYPDDEFRPWNYLTEARGRIERDMRHDAIKKTLTELVEVWGFMIDASTEVQTAARAAGYSNDGAEEIALGFVLKVTAGATSGA